MDAVLMELYKHYVHSKNTNEHIPMQWKKYNNNVK